LAEENLLNFASKFLAEARRVVVLTGAGVSAESGVPTFRGKDGLWKRFRAEELATPEAFSRNPRLVWEWYDWRRQIIARAKPNPAHQVIAEMEKYYPEFLLITQNVDGLHLKAGSRRIVEIHGNLWRLRCDRCGRKIENYEVPLKEIPPRCPCGSLYRPDVVWFGEPIPADRFEAAWCAARSCDLMLVAGTSAVVQPAASLPVMAKSHGARIVEVNLEPTPITGIADVSLFGRAGEILPKLWEKVKPKSA